MATQPDPGKPLTPAAGVLACSYQDSLSGELRADSDNVLANGTGGTNHGSARSGASAGSYSPASASAADGSSSNPGAAQLPTGTLDAAVHFSSSAVASAVADNSP
jgi:hypothetical protein